MAAAPGPGAAACGLPPAAHPLRRWRARNHWPLRRLADTVGATPTTCSRIEAGRQFPRPALLRRLIGLTGIPAERFLAQRKI